jgi:hypothetical protein
MVVFQTNMDNYPHITIAADGSLCSTGQHRPGFPRVLYGALRQLGYDGDAPVYRGCMSMAHGQDKCEVNVVIPLNPMEPWMATVIGVELDETVKQTAQVALTSLCETRIADTATMPTALFLIRNQEDPMWKQRLEAVSNPEGPTSTLAWLPWLGTRSTCLTCRQALTGPSCGSICTRARLSSTSRS